MFKFSFNWQGQIRWRHVAVAISVGLAMLHALGVLMPLRWLAAAAEFGAAITAPLVH